MKIVSFDFWDTLYRLPGTRQTRAAIRYAELLKACRLRGLSSPEPIAESFFDNVDEFIKERWAKGLPTTRKQSEIHAATRWPELSVEDIGALFLVIEDTYKTLIKPELTEGAFEALKWLHPIAPIYLVSDTFTLTGQFLTDIMRSDGVLQFFKGTFFSDEIGVKKPNPYSFRKILELEECLGSDLLHVGDDRSTDFVGVSSIGGAFLHIGSSLDTDTFESIATLKELPLALRSSFHLKSKGTSAS